LKRICPFFASLLKKIKRKKKKREETFFEFWRPIKFIQKELFCVKSTVVFFFTRASESSNAMETMASYVSLDGGVGGVVQNQTSPSFKDGCYHRKRVQKRNDGKREQQRHSRNSNRRMMRMMTTRSSLKRDEDAAKITTETKTTTREERGEETKRSRRRKAYVDGANVCWAYCAALRASNNALAKIPISTALTVVCRYFQEVEEFEEVVVFAPKNYARGKLNGLCDGGSLRLLHPEKVQYVGENEWENVYLRQMVDDGVLKLIDRQNDVRGRSADDLAILDEAFEHSINERHNTVVVVSNDKYEGHCPSSASGDKKAFRDWLKRTRKGYEFDIAKFDVATVEKEKWPKVGAMNGNLQCPDGFDEWVEDEHAWGSSRPWSKETTWTERKLFSRKKKKRRRGGVGGSRVAAEPPGLQSKNEDGEVFPHHVLPLGSLNVTFTLKQ
jgi:hypothetical protein